MPKVQDVLTSTEAEVDEWRHRLLRGPITAWSTKQSEQILVISACEAALANAREHGTDPGVLTIRESRSPVVEIARLLARQLVYLMREQPWRMDLAAKRAERFQMAVGLPVTRRYDMETATMAYALAGCSPAAVPRPPDVPAVCSGALCPLFQEWAKVEG